VHGQLQWRVRCAAASGPSCGVDRTLSAFDREAGATMQCSVVETATTRTLTFFGSFGSDYGLSLMNAELPRAGGSPSARGGCSVLAVESGGIWGGDCGATTAPCRVDITFGADAESSLVVGQIFCASMTPLGGGTALRDLTATGEGTAAETTPAVFAFRNCAGYVPDAP